MRREDEEAGGLIPEKGAKEDFYIANCYLITYTFQVAFYLGHYSRATLKTIGDTQRRDAPSSRPGES